MWMSYDDPKVQEPYDKGFLKPRMNLDNGESFEISEQSVLLSDHFRITQMCGGELDEAGTRGWEVCEES